MPAHPKPAPKAKKPGAMRSAPKKKTVTDLHAVTPAEKAAAAEAQGRKPSKATKPKAAAKKAGFEERGPIPRKAAKKATSAKPAPAGGTSKSDLILGMLRKPGGASSKEIEAATGWAPHSVRGFLGTLRKKGVNVVSTKFAKGEATVYSIDAAGKAESVGDVV